MLHFHPHFIFLLFIFSQCITFSTLSNTIAPLFSSYVFSQASLSSVILLSQTKGDKSLISNIDADAYHILFQRFKNSSDISLQGSGSTFSVSIYMDGSIRFRYHTISLKTLNYVLDYAGLWGSRISDADSAYLRYHNVGFLSSFFCLDLSIYSAIFTFFFSLSLLLLLSAILIAPISFFILFCFFYLKYAVRILLRLVVICISNSLFYFPQSHIFSLPPHS